MSQYRMPPAPVLTPWSPEANGLVIANGVMSATRVLFSTTSTAWPTANRAFFYSFRLFDWATAYQLLVFIGATSSGNIDVGIYDSQKNLVVSAGSTAMSATVNTVQEFNIANTVLPPGDYLIGVACDNNTGACFSTTTNDELIFSYLPIYEQQSAFPLPNPCVPVASTLNTPPFVVCGIQFRPTF